jgi:hypothetical protein
VAGEPADVVAAFAADAGGVGDAVERGATPGCAVCGEADFGAPVVVLEAADVAFEVGTDAGLRAVAAVAVVTVEAMAEPAAAPGAAAVVEAGAAFGAAERVGGSGASSDPRSAGSIIGDAHVPEYAASEGADAHDPDVEVLVEAPELADPFDARLDVFVAAGLAPWFGFAAGTAGIPNPAGDLCVSVAVVALAGA